MTKRKTPTAKQELFEDRILEVLRETEPRMIAGKFRLDDNLVERLAYLVLEMKQP